MVVGNVEESISMPKIVEGRLILETPSRDEAKRVVEMLKKEGVNVGVVTSKKRLTFINGYVNGSLKVLEKTHLRKKARKVYQEYLKAIEIVKRYGIEALEDKVPEYVYWTVFNQYDDGLPTENPMLYVPAKRKDAVYVKYFVYEKVEGENFVAI